MNKNAITYSSLVMTFIGLLFLAEIRGELNTAKEHKELADFWKSRVGREQLKKLIVQGQFADFKQDVAILLPGYMEKKKIDSEKQKIRNLASVIPHEGTHEITLGFNAQKLLEDGKRNIKKRNFRQGIKLLNKLINRFPDSYHVIEAHYLMMEAYSQQNQKLAVIEWVDKMVELFPENRLTGFAMLKVGSIYENDGRPEDAVRIYKTILAVYDDKVLSKQAQKAVKEIQL